MPSVAGFPNGNIQSQIVLGVVSLTSSVDTYGVSDIVMLLQLPTG